MDKICKSCSSRKPYENFRISKKTGAAVNPCFDCRKKRKEKYNATHVEINNLAKKKWAYKNQEKVKEARKKWKEANIGKVKADKARCKIAVAQATPKWLSKDQIEAIECSYMMAELRTQCSDVKYHVDHIIPIRGKDVCGLNVPWNLETIPENENLKKGNKLLSWRKGADLWIK